MPKSKSQKKAVYTPPQKAKEIKLSPRWLAPTMVASWIIGILWIATFYVTNVAGVTVPLMTDLHNWNLGIGFAFIIFGVVLSTRWR